MGILTAMLVAIAISFLIKWILLTLVFYAAGRIVSGVNAKFTDALLVALIGSIVSELLHFGFNYALSVLGIALPELFAIIASALITLIVYIPLFMHFFDVGFGGALLIGLLCVIFYVIIGVIMVFVLGVLILLLILGP